MSALTLALCLGWAGCQAPGDALVRVDEASPTPALDADHDGYTEIEGDCDDSDPAAYPGAPEGAEDPSGLGLDPDGTDNDCDGRIDNGTLQFDDDQDSYSEAQGDCDDADGARHPGILDGCDGIDNDCDGTIDEDALDAYEPNDTKIDASDFGDQTCNSGAPYVAYFNIYPEGDAETPADRDFFKFKVREGSDTGCTFGVQVDLSGDMDDLDFSMNLYRESGGSLVLLDSVKSTAQKQDYTLKYPGTSNFDDTAYYYVEVESAPNASTFRCSDNVRLTFYGFIPYVP
jgi:hypothetical protein